MQPEDNVSIPLTQLGLAILTMVSSWFIFWCPYFTIINVVLALIFSGLMLILLFFLDRIRPNWRFNATRGQRTTLWVVTVVVSLASPILLYWWVIQIANMVIRDIDIDVQPDRYEVRLVDTLDIGSSPMRRIEASYTVVDPLDPAVVKITDWAHQQNPQWQVSKQPPGLRQDGTPTELYAACDPGSPTTGGGIHHLILWNDNLLTLMIRFSAAPQACGLPSNPFNYWVYSGY